MKSKFLFLFVTDYIQFFIIFLDNRFLLLIFLIISKLRRKNKNIITSVFSIINNNFVLMLF